MINAFQLACLSVVIAKQILTRCTCVSAPTISWICEIQYTIIHWASLNTLKRYYIVCECALRRRTVVSAQVCGRIAYMATWAFIRKHTYSICETIAVCGSIATKNTPSGLVILGIIAGRAIW